MHDPFDFGAVAEHGSEDTLHAVGSVDLHERNVVVFAPVGDEGAGGIDIEAFEGGDEGVDGFEWAHDFLRRNV